MRQLGIWIGREFKARATTKGYWVFTIIGLVLLIAFTFLPAIMKWVNHTTETQIVMDDPQQIVAPLALKAVNGAPNRYNFKLTSSGAVGVEQYSASQMKNYMKEQHAKLVVVVQGDTAAHASFVIEENGTVDPTELQSLQALLQQQVTQARVATLPQQSQSVLASAVNFSTHQWQSGSKSINQLWQSRILVYYMLALLFGTLVNYGNWVAQGVIEEKSNRIIEMMLITSKPWQILFGKVVGIGLVGLLQYGVWIVGILGVSLVRSNLGGLPIQNVPVATIALFPVFFIIGYLLYAVLYAIAGSLVHRSEEQQMAVTPVVLLMVLLFYMAMFGVLPNPDSIFAKVVSFIPVASPMTMYTRVALTDVPFWQVGIAIALNLLCAWGLVRYGAHVYRKFALRTTGKASWKLLFQSQAAGAVEGNARQD